MCHWGNSFFFWEAATNFLNTPKALQYTILRKTYMSYGFEQNPYLIQIINSIAVQESIFISLLSSPLRPLDSLQRFRFECMHLFNCFLYWFNLIIWSLRLIIQLFIQQYNFYFLCLTHRRELSVRFLSHMFHNSVFWCDAGIIRLPV